MSGYSTRIFFLSLSPYQKFYFVHFQIDSCLKFLIPKISKIINLPQRKYLHKLKTDIFICIIIINRVINKN